MFMGNYFISKYIEGHLKSFIIKLFIEYNNYFSIIVNFCFVYIFLSLIIISFSIIGTPIGTYVRWHILALSPIGFIRLEGLVSTRAQRIPELEKKMAYIYGKFL